MICDLWRLKILLRFGLSCWLKFNLQLGTSHHYNSVHQSFLGQYLHLAGLEHNCLDFLKIFCGATFFCGTFIVFFCLVFAVPLCASVYMCFVVTCWERTDLFALVCGA